MYCWELLHPCVSMIYVHFLVQTATITKCPVKKNTAGKKCIKMHTSIKSSDAYVHGQKHRSSSVLEPFENPTFNTKYNKCIRRQSRAKHILNEQCYLALMWT